ncbi:phosphatase PAP2 family protein [Candidatus Woesebacteria bacterium]|nr:MAG: phosphatase PAP2 family protein [Candidatus Woesebacteria bacterium]
MGQIPFLTLLALLSFLGYFYTNKRPYKYEFKTKIDDRLKLIPVFVIPYLSLFPLLVVTYLSLDHISLLKFLLALIVVNVTSSLFWFYIPNGVRRYKVDKYDTLSKIINYIYIHDGDTNGFPSAHVFLSTICTYYLYSNYNNLAYIILGLIIILSTVFIKQHYVVDILGGLLFATIALVTSGLLLANY